MGLYSRNPQHDGQRYDRPVTAKPASGEASHGADNTRSIDRNRVARRDGVFGNRLAGPNRRSIHAIRFIRNHHRNIFVRPSRPFSPTRWSWRTSRKGWIAWHTRIGNGAGRAVSET